MSALDYIDELFYRSYCGMRRECPETPVNHLRSTYGPAVDHFEAMYQAEKDAKFEDLLRAAAASLLISTRGDL
jgi:hypothetical protein